MRYIDRSTIIELKCTKCNKKYSADEINTLCSCGGVLFAKYNLEQAKETVEKDSFNKRPFNVWRIPELMPVKNSKYRFSLGEGFTPIISLSKVSNLFGNFDLNLYAKDEGQNPTGTFKSRGLDVAISKAVELGVKDFVIPTAGNAGAALAAYCNYIGVSAHIYMPKDTPDIIKREVQAFGADLHLVNGLITDAADQAKRDAMSNQWFDVSTLKEPYRVEGKKTMSWVSVPEDTGTLRVSNNTHKGVLKQG